MIEQAINKITSLQPKERTAVWLVGEHLKELCRASSHDAEIILQDLEIPEMSLAKAEEKIEALAKQREVRHGNKGTGFVAPQEAENILRKFYGLTAREENPSNFQAKHPEPHTSEPTKAVALDLDDFL